MFLNNIREKLPQGFQLHLQGPDSLCLVKPLALGLIINCACMILRKYIMDLHQASGFRKHGMEDRADCLEAQAVVACFLLNTVATHYEALA